MKTTKCDTCGARVELVLDQVLELRIVRALVCPLCAERLVRLKPGAPAVTPDAS